MTAPRTDGDLRKARVATWKTVAMAPDAFLSDPTVAVFAIARIGPADLTAAVRAGRRTAAIPAAPRAMSRSGRSAVDTAIPLAHRVGR